MKKLLLTSVIFIFSLSAHSQGLWQANGNNVVYSMRSVGIATSSPTQKLDVAGGIHSFNSYTDSLAQAMQMKAKSAEFDFMLTLNAQMDKLSVNFDAIIKGKLTADKLIANSDAEVHGKLAANQLRVTGNSELTDVTTKNISAQDIKATSLDAQKIFINGNPVQTSPWSINPDGTISYNGDVFVRNLGVSGSIAVGSFKFSNGSNQITPVTDSIRTPFRIAIASDAKSIDLISDTLRFGSFTDIKPISSSQVRLTVQGDIAASGAITSDKITANSLQVQGSINANCVTTSCLNVSGQTSFDILNVANKITTPRITSTDSLIRFGDSTLVINTTSSQIFNDELSIGSKGVAIGKGSNASSSGSVAIGTNVWAGLGADNAIVIGSNDPNFGFFVNPIPNSLAVGFNSNIPTLFVSPANGAGTTGKVTVGVPASGGVAGKFQVVENALNQPAIVAGDTNASSIWLVPNLSVGGYNDITKQGDAGIIFRNQDHNTGNAGFVIAPHDALNRGLRIDQNGNVGIGSCTTDLANKLEVNGTIRSKEWIVELNNWCDYKFEPGYQRMTWKEKQDYLGKFKHLPAIASEKELKTKGIKGTEILHGLVYNVEDNTLDIIDLQKENETLKKEVVELKKQMLIIISTQKK